MNNNFFICKICGTKGDFKVYTPKEMMYGFRDEFKYFQCAECGCLQIKDYPINLEKYYPNNYYSYNIKHNEEQPAHSSVLNKIKKILINIRDISILYPKYKYSIFGKVLCKFFPNKYIRNDGIGCYNQMFLLPELRLNSKILDIGCGNGAALVKIQKYGFSSLTGADPFIDKDIEYSNGVRIMKKSIQQIDDKFDIVLMSHSFEHMPDPIDVFKSLKNILAPSGVALIDIPVSDSGLFERKGVNWVQLDAPRHLFLHTTKSMNYLASKHNMTIQKFNSSSFWSYEATEGYIQDIPLLNQRNDFKKSIQFKKELEECHEKDINDDKADSNLFILRNK